MSATLAVFTGAAGAEQAQVVADVALLLAADGHDVIVVDTEPDGGSALEALRHLPARSTGPGELPVALDAALDLLPGTGSTSDAEDESVAAWRTVRLRSLRGTITVGSPVGALDDDANGRVAALCAGLHDAAPHDAEGPAPVVLLHRPGRPDAAALEVARTTADVLVLTITGRELREPAELARDLHRRRPDGLHVLCLALERTPVDRPHALAERVVERFDAVSIPPDALTVIPVHTDPRMLEADAPVVLLAPGSAPAVSLARAASRLAGSEVPAEVPASLLSGVDRAVRGLDDGAAREIVYATPDRLAADQVARWLRDAGVVPYRPRPGATAQGGVGPLVVLSARLSAAELEALPAGSVGVLLDGEGPLPTVGMTVVDLRAIPEDGRRAELLGALDLLLREFAGPPGRVPPVDPTRGLDRVPARATPFRGREELLESLRDVLAPLEGAPDVRPRVVLGGEPGVGKSATAIAYVNRFARDYVGVVHVAAATAGAVAAGFAEVDNAIDAAPPPIRTDGRWLVVLDDADADALAAVGPARPEVDVVITTGEPVALEDKETLTVLPLDPADGAILLRERGRGLAELGRAETVDVLDVVGGLPVPLALSRCYLRDTVAARQAAQWTVEDAIADGVATLRASLSDGPPAWSPVSRILAAVRGLAAEHEVGRLVVRLAELCSFLAADGIGLDLIRSRPFVEALAACPDGPVLRADELVLDRLLTAGDRMGLFDVNWGAPATLRMHRVLRWATTEVMDDEARTARHAEVLTALARYAPFSPGLEHPSPELRELDRHLLPTGVLEAAEQDGIRAHCGDPAAPGTAGWDVRRWVVDQFAHRLHFGDRNEYTRSLEQVAVVEQRWAEAYGPDDPLRLRMLDVRGGLLDALERNAQALEVDDRTLRLMRDALGPLDLRTINVTGGVAGDLRRLGQWREQLPEAAHVYRTLVDVLGREHPRTLAAGQNFADARFLSGRHFLALELHRRCHSARYRVLGPSHPWYRGSLRQLGVYLREVGDLVAADGVLQEASLQGDSEVDPRAHQQRLRAERALAVVRRRLAPPDRPPSPTGTRRLIRRLEAAFGPDHPEVLAAQLALAVELSGTGAARAVERAAAVTRALAGTMGAAHPFVGAAMADRALVAVRAGDAEGALSLAAEADGLLAAAVDDVHPWRIAVANTRARALAVADRGREADALLNATTELCADYLDADRPRADSGIETDLHPVARAVLGNRAAADEDGVAAAAHDRWRDLDIDVPSV